MGDYCGVVRWLVMLIERVKLSLVPGLEIEFTDRDRGIRQVYELAKRGIRAPVVVYGPEGCGKTSWLK
jgi:predicted AAA+ superfamily ATPase